MAKENEKTLTVDSADLDAWAKETGVTPEALTELRERIDAKEVDRNRGQVWKRIMKVLGFTALIGAGVGAGVYVAHEAVEAMPEAAALVAKRELGERGEALKAQAEAVKKSSELLIAKIGAFLQVLPKAASNYETITNGFAALLGGGGRDVQQLVLGQDSSPDQIMESLNKFLENDKELAPYWTAVSAAYDDLKKKGMELATMKGAFDVTETDKAQAWDDYKNVLWGDIQEDFATLVNKIPTSAPAPESPK
jgi:hypothetical protein